MTLETVMLSVVYAERYYADCCYAYMVMLNIVVLSSVLYNQYNHTTFCSIQSYIELQYKP
jgi:hypothetical protein